MDRKLSQLPSSTAWLVHVSADVVLISVRKQTLSVLLRKRYSESLNQSFWALPGGYIRPTESLEQCVFRTLVQQTGMHHVHIQQLQTFGEPDRHPKSRVITTAYLALVSEDRASEVLDSKNVGWHDVSCLPELYLDHSDIIAVARSRLQSEIANLGLICRLVPELFTLSELQEVHEIIAGRPFDSSKFKERILSRGELEGTGRFRTACPDPQAQLYRYRGWQEPSAQHLPG